jgi:hypothetical protein
MAAWALTIAVLGGRLIIQYCTLQWRLFVVALTLVVEGRRAGHDKIRVTPDPLECCPRAKIRR